ncbi:MAG: GNAT family N-acetyltransferase [Elusimicrobium sp.]|jgi:GNAT superfamily N-acetyltransferase|nr:GNAT family N-acetyltransferase [Elusimicrobium sp.]
MTDFKIERIGAADFEKLFELFKEFADFEKRKFSNSLKRMKAEKDFFGAFAVKDAAGNILAYAIFFYSYHTFTGKTLYMDDLYVLEPYRRNGLGRKLLERVIAEAKEQGCAGVRWQVADWNTPAKKLYASFGAVENPEDRNRDIIF